MVLNLLLKIKNFNTFVIKVKMGVACSVNSPAKNHDNIFTVYE